MTQRIAKGLRYLNTDSLPHLVRIVRDIVRESVGTRASWLYGLLSQKCN